MDKQKNYFLKTLLALYVLLSASFLQADNFSIGQKHITIHNPKNSHHTITAQLFYPSKKEGPRGVIADGKFPLILFAHGYQQIYSTYHNIWEELVPKGYIFAFITTQKGLLIDIDEYADDIVFLYNVLYSKNRSSKTIITGHLTDKSALMGHSTGGGAIYIAQTSLPKVTTTISLAALGKNYGPISGSAAIDSAKSTTSPTLILSGSNDCICPVDIFQKPLYAQITQGRVMATIIGGDHCGFSDSWGCPVTESLFCVTSDQSKNMNQKDQMNLALHIITPWLDHFLKNKPKALANFKSMLKSDILTYKLDMK